MPSNDAVINIRANDRKLASDLKKSNKRLASFGNSVKRGIGKAFGGVATLGGIGGFLDIGKEALEFEESLGAMARQAGDPALIDPFRDMVKNTARATGQTQADVLALMESYVSLKGASSLTEDVLLDLTKAAVGSGIAFSEMAQFSLVATNTLKLQEDQQISLISGILAIGKTGSIQAKEMTRALRVAGDAAVQTFGSGRQAGILLTATLNGIASSFGSVDEMATAFNATTRSIEKNAKKLEDAGIEVFEIDENGVKTMRSILDLSLEIPDDLLIDVLPDSTARKTVRAIRKNIALINEYTEAGEDATVALTDFGDKQESAAGRARTALNAAKQSLIDLATPERIESFASALGDMADVVAFVADNFKSLLIVGVAWKGIGLAGALMKQAGAMKLFGLNTSLATGFMGEGFSKAGKLSKGMRALGVAGGLAGAAFIGWELGTMLDEALGLSDSLGDSLLFLSGQTPEQIAARNRKQDVSENEAIDTLRAGGLLEGRQISGALVRQISRKETAGEELNEQEKAANVLLESDLGFQAEGGGLFQKLLSAGDTAGFVATNMERDTQTAERDAEIIAALKANTAAVNALAEAPPPVVNMDGEKVSKGVKNSKANKRAPRR